MRKDPYADPRLYEPEGYVDENGHYRDEGDYRDGPQGGLILWGAVLLSIFTAFGALGWGIAQALQLLNRLVFG